MNQNVNNLLSTNQDNVDAVNILVKEIVKAIRQKSVNCDHTYPSTIKGITPKGYLVLDEAGQERTAKCCIPGVELKVGDSVFIKIPNGNLKQIHIAGISGKTTATTTAEKIGSSTAGSAKKAVNMNHGTLTACSSSTITYSDTEPLDLNLGATWIDT